MTKRSIAYTELLSSDPEDASVHVLLAIAYRRRRKDEEARQSAETAPAVKRNEAHKGAMSRIRNNAALFLSLQVFAQTPSTPLERRLQQAQQHLDADRFEQAIAELQKAVQQKPDLPGAYYQLGYAHWKLNRFPAARRFFRRELQFQPPDVFSHYYLGRIAEQEANIPAAVRQYERVLALHPVLDVYERLGSAYMRLHQLDRAIPSAREGGGSSSGPGRGTVSPRPGLSAGGPAC